MLKMPKEQLREALIIECDREMKFIQSHGNVNVSNQRIYKPSSIGVQFLAMNDIKPLKKVRFIIIMHSYRYDNHVSFTEVD